MSRNLISLLCILLLFSIAVLNSCRGSKTSASAEFSDSVKLNCRPHVSVFQWPESDVMVKMRLDSTTQVYPFVDEFHMTALNNLNFSLRNPSGHINISKEDKGGYFLYDLLPASVIPDSVRYIDLQIWYKLPSDTLVVFQDCKEKDNKRVWQEMRKEFPTEGNSILLYTYTFVNEQDGYLYNIGGFRGLVRSK